ncbi:acyltransferase [Lithospermum erythrorhizon]|uniref:Acyltransferase n=1 Tax=Lithospermum erythrorhizon TaxID=34254 RepID=A0AAV3QS44_LITER
MEVESKEQETETAEITLRLLDPSDLDDLLELLTDEEVVKWCSWDTFTSKESAMNYIIGFALPHPFFRAICMKNKVVGSITVSPFKGNDSCRAELGYVVASKYWGKGVATKAVEMVAATIFVEWPHLERLEALADVENPGSQRVLEKAGFKKEGVMRKYCLLKGKPRDMVMFSLISSDQQVNYGISD